MHSIYQRFSNISALLSTCMLALFGAISISSLLFTADPKGTLSISSINVHPGRNNHFHQRNHEFSFVRFNVSADLTPLFNWNTKQLFLYIGAEFTSADGTQNEVVIWDRIVRRKEDAVINVSSKSKYVLRDMARTFEKVSPANYTLKYNVMPYIGLLTYGEAARTNEPIAFPAAQKRVT
ncbi:signal peptidase [Fomitiporia mediterranea MF3/22]|uniref:signal peptidase n=1 Tax=Fomitiporia mediterranea (strain MF3/22) TaxID=694068 RepID=UPI000440823B|nr:signal peptidase [Fomitiporia mediterranea MF3/22]EJD00644.1 signal peptidase [Fomitiporia mediterranea MF3/22]